jgi:putative tricarboxylic transport membrane protein
MLAMSPSLLRNAVLAIAATGFLALGAHTAAADDPYYKGRRLVVLVNYAAGGPTDIEARLLAKHIAKHIDGQPTAIVQNMDGAGGLIGTNYLGEIAPKDGTMLGYFTGAAWSFANDPDRFRIDFRNYEFLAYQPGTTVYFMRADTPPGMKTATDIVKAKDLVAGGLAAENAKDLLIRLTLDMLGVPYRYVTSYRGSSAARMALQQGEINFYSESPPSYRGVIEPSLVRDGIVLPVFYDPGYDGETFRVPKQVEGLPILPFHELYQKAKGSMPSGRLWDIYRTILAVNGAMQRMILMPPGAPASAAETLRAAIQRLNTDQAYAEESLKSIGFVPQWEASADTNRQVRKALTTPPDTRTFIADYIKSANK